MRAASTLRIVAIGAGIVVAVAVLVAGCGLVVAASSLPSGELPNVDFKSDEITAAREAVLPELEVQLDDVEARFGRPHVGPRARIDRCDAGFDDFTRHDRYAYSCRMTVVQLMPVREPFEPNASRLGEALLEGHCPAGTDTDRALAEPFDHPRHVDASSGDCTVGSRVPGPEIRHWLTRAPTDEDLHLARTYLGAHCYPSNRGEHCEVTDLDLRAVVAAAPGDAAYLALVVAEDADYDVPWDCPWPASWFREGCGS